ncbi:helix-turn-helix domain-containing protein [Cohnella sp. 56]|uniref:helix-turn-helix domain-containing protein n=1 Tax=Cohnella sp. 56 TaxID=3113722 RepID=UPI0030E9B62F
MSIRYFNILMNHLEKMQFEVTAASFEELTGRETEPPDVYDCNRALLVTGGKGILHMDDRSFPMKAGTFSFLLAGRQHSMQAQRGETLSYWWCHFRASYADRAIFKEIGMPEHVSIPDPREAIALFERIGRNLLADQPTSRLRLKTSFMELVSVYLDHIVADTGIQETPSPEIEKLEIVLSYVDEHLADSITVEDLAGLIFLHPNYFIVYFKSLMGCSPIQYVNQRRLEVARTLLADPACNVSDAASRIGMKIYYFSRMFKAYTGLTPSRYKKLVLGTAKPVLGSGDPGEPRGQ